MLKWIKLDVKNKFSTQTEYAELMPREIVNKEKVFEPKLLLILITAELKAHQERRWIIYRTSNSWSPDKIIANKSDSFGTRLFGGIIHDSLNVKAEESACAFARLTCDSKLHICKLNIHEKDLNYNFVYVPPFLALVDFCIFGEYFHTRLKAYPDKQGKIKGIYLFDDDEDDVQNKEEKGAGFINHQYLFADKEKFKKFKDFLADIIGFILDRYQVYKF